MLLLFFHKKESSSFAGSSICSKLIKQIFVVILLHSKRCYHNDACHDIQVEIQKKKKKPHDSIGMKKFKI